MWLTLALPAHVLVKALSPAFFAREDTMTPLVATLKGVVLAIAAAFLLGHWFGADGIAAAIALGAWSIAFSLIRHGAETLWLFDRCRREAAAAAHRRWRRSPWAALLWLATRFLPALASGAHGLVQAVALLDRDRSGNRDLWPVSAAFRRHRLARSG